MIAHAEQKLYLDAVVIKKGLQGKADDVNPNQLLEMVFFGAQNIFDSEAQDLTDEDIKQIIGKSKPEVLSETKKKVFENAEHSDLNFDWKKDFAIYMFGGKDYVAEVEKLRKKTTEDPLPQTTFNLNKKGCNRIYGRRNEKEGIDTG